MAAAKIYGQVKQSVSTLIWISNIILCSYYSIWWCDKVQNYYGTPVSDSAIHPIEYRRFNFYSHLSSIYYSLQKQKVRITNVYILAEDDHTRDTIIHYRLIRLNSPNLNYLIIGGMILLYFGGIGFVIPATDNRAVPPICLGTS